MPERSDYIDGLLEKVKLLNATTWESRFGLEKINPWLDQFAPADAIEDDEQLHALFLLSHFIYFGQAEVRELLRSLYRDLYRGPLIHAIRRANEDTRDLGFIKDQFEKTRDRTRFLGVGNPSESGVHLLYYFRQENALPKTLFINSHELFRRENGSGDSRTVIRDPKLEHYVFIDDLCGSGTQEKEYSVDLISPLKKEKPDATVSYFVLFATSTGLNAVRQLRCFDHVAAVFELDPSFKALEPGSRLFSPEEYPYLRARVRATCQKYGRKVCPAHPLGYKDGQLLIAFSHNTPDNTLPIFWAEEGTSGPWTPIFRRYQKKYGW